MTNNHHNHKKTEEKPNHWPIHRWQALVKSSRPGGNLLEIGCGYGQVLEELHSNYDKVYGIDIDAERIAATQQKLNTARNVTLVTSTLSQFLEEKPKDLLFDCIVWADVVEHVVDVIQDFQIITAVSASNAQLVTVTPNIAYLRHRLRLLFGEFPSTSLPIYNNEGFKNKPEDTDILDGGHLHYFTFSSLKKLYEISGFTNISQYGFGGTFSKMRNWYPKLLSGSICMVGYYNPGSREV